MRAILLATVVGLGVAGWLGDPPAARAEPGDAPVVINALVPAGAQLWVDGAKTKQTGDNRRFVSPPIRSGHVYVYHVRVVSDGRDIDKAVRVRAGDNITLDFTGAEVRESRGQPAAAPDTGVAQLSYTAQPQNPVKTFAQQSSFGAYSWSMGGLPFPEWNNLAIPSSQRYPRPTR
jgi:uncharacterized protein (TIGR03000 family)